MLTEFLQVNVRARADNMKIIVAGMPKTGTKSMNAALTKLGYNVYDFLEHAYCHNKEWEEILETGGSNKLFQNMYKDIDVVVDGPANYFWEQIHEAFPDAKIILMTRDEDAWYKSALLQLREMNEWSLFRLATIITPTGRSYHSHMSKALLMGFSVPITSALIDIKPIERISRLKFRQHNCYVQQRAPKDKLLVMDVKDGWEPLCKFLGAKVPDTPFPHKNIGGKAFEEAAENPAMLQIIRELYMVFALATVLLSLGIFWSPLW